MVIETCPIAPCPIPHTEDLVDAIIPIGTCIESPGKSYIYEVISPPVKRKFLDFKGLFEKPIAVEKVLGDVSDATIISFLAQYRKGHHFILPSIGRMFWIFFAALMGREAPYWYFNLNAPLSPFRVLPHLDESDPKHKGRTHFHTYKVNVFYKTLDDNWKKGEPTLLTVRWEPTFVLLF